MGRLTGKVALVTGAAGGQGAAEARLFAAEGARVVLADVIDEPGRKLAAELGSVASYEHLDVASERDWARVMAALMSAHGRLDVLVNNAGILRAAPLEHTSLDDYMAVIRVNQVGVFLGMRAAIDPMRASGGGSIINISSNAGMQGVQGVVGYVASKWAVRGMTKTAALELGRYGIRVNSVHPGAVDTPMIATPEFEAVDRDGLYRSLPIARMARPEEIARLVLFLASDESSYSTGAEFLADGGISAGLPGAGVPNRD
jgi:3alpha(or 20beta)-hydroxysteroid dehydrogenase